MLTEVLVVILISSATAKSGLPVFDKTYEDVRIADGYEAAIWCNASGDLPMIYTWHDENNEQIHLDEKSILSVLYAPDGSALIFNVSELYHSGLYICSAENSHGLVTKVYNVSVYPTGNRTDESVVIHQVDIDNVTDSSVTFFITASGNPLLYIVTYTEELEKIERNVTITAAELIEITGLIPSGSYKFQFKGQSAVTVSENWSRVYEVVLLPGAPEVIFRSLGGGALKIEWFRKFDDFMRKTFEGYKLSYNSVSMMRGNYWIYNDCVTDVYIPFCGGTTHTIAGLSNKVYYEIRLSAQTKGGFGKPTTFKVYLE